MPNLQLTIVIATGLGWPGLGLLGLEKWVCLGFISGLKGKKVANRKSQTWNYAEECKRGGGNEATTVIRYLIALLCLTIPLVLLPHLFTLAAPVLLSLYLFYTRSLIFKRQTSRTHPLLYVGNSTPTPINQWSEYPKYKYYVALVPNE